jgi:hypothetical protein
VLIVDCFFSGAFARGSKGEADLEQRLAGQGRGRAVLTASRAGEYSFEGDPLPGRAAPGSVFTAALIEGIVTGAADADRDGYITLDEAYTYAFEHVRENSGQTPQRWLYGLRGPWCWPAARPGSRSGRPGSPARCRPAWTARTRPSGSAPSIPSPGGWPARIQGGSSPRTRRCAASPALMPPRSPRLPALTCMPAA